MIESSARFSLPFILPGQAQKEHFHNEAVALIDSALHPAVEEGPTDVPPAAPQEGQSWLTGANPGGSWSGKADSLATWTSAGWRFVAAVPGMAVWKKNSAVWLYWNGIAWSDGELTATRIVIEGQQVVGKRLAGVPSPSGGTTIDTEARAAIAALIATFVQHGLTE